MKPDIAPGATSEKKRHCHQQAIHISITYPVYQGLLFVPEKSPNRKFPCEIEKRQLEKNKLTLNHITDGQEIASNSYRASLNGYIKQ